MGTVETKKDLLWQNEVQMRRRHTQHGRKCHDVFECLCPIFTLCGEIIKRLDNFQFLPEKEESE